MDFVIVTHHILTKEEIVAEMERQKELCRSLAAHYLQERDKKQARDFLSRAEGIQGILDWIEANDFKEV